MRLSPEEIDGFTRLFQQEYATHPQVNHNPQLALESFLYQEEMRRRTRPPGWEAIKQSPEWKLMTREERYALGLRQLRDTLNYVPAQQRQSPEFQETWRQTAREFENQELLAIRSSTGLQARREALANSWDSTRNNIDMLRRSHVARVRQQVVRELERLDGYPENYRASRNSRAVAHSSTIKERRELLERRLTFLDEELPQITADIEERKERILGRAGSKGANLFKQAESLRDFALSATAEDWRGGLLDMFLESGVSMGITVRRGSQEAWPAAGWASEVPPWAGLRASGWAPLRWNIRPGFMPNTSSTCGSVIQNTTWRNPHG